MSHRGPLESITLSDLIKLLCSESAEAGSGTAASVALALGAACFAKATVLSARSDGRPPTLRDASDQLCHFATEALRLADRESQRFAETIRSEDATAARDLIQVDERLLQLAERIQNKVEELSPHVDRSLQGDVLAARALRAAGVTILRRNEAENARDAEIPTR